jgi:hypothetical protein
MIAIYTFNNADQYFKEHLVGGLILIGIVFIILGWLLSRLLRPPNYMLEDEIRHTKKQLISDLNTAKKFNTDCKLLATKEKSQYKKGKYTKIDHSLRR